MEKKFNLDEFFRQLYLRAEPSLDITTVEGPINPADYKLKLSILDEIEEEFDLKAYPDLQSSVAMLILDKGPQLIN